MHIGTLWKSLRLAWRRLCKSCYPSSSRHLPVMDTHYFQQEATTLPYPHASFPVPTNGRYRLHNEIVDCIVCDRCASACPVDCIEIVATQAAMPLEKTSNGMVKRLIATRFDIDMAKCCFCGLCTTVCPTACLTMTSTYDYSVFDWADHKVPFARTQAKVRTTHASCVGNS